MEQHMRQFDIPEQHRFAMLQMLGKQQTEDLPERVCDVYWIAKRGTDRASRSLAEYDLLAILLTSGALADSPPIPDPTSIELYRSGKLKDGDTVYCKWRGQNGKQAVVMGANAEDKLIIRFVGKAEEYPLSASDVSVEAPA